MNDGYLEEKRKAIAETDKEIIILLKKRLDLATEIGQYKAQNGLEVRNLDVEQRVVDRYRYLEQDGRLGIRRGELVYHHELGQRTRSAVRRCMEHLHTCQ